MKKENYDYLKSKYYHWVVLRDAQYMKDINNEERQRFLNILREEFSPNALYCLTCPNEVAELVRTLFTQFDKYESQLQANTAYVIENDTIISTEEDKPRKKRLKKP